jgi:hypothetical protein
MNNPPFPCTVERLPLAALAFPFLHNVVCESLDDLHPGDLIVAIAGVPLVNPITVINPGTWADHNQNDLANPLVAA